MGLDMYLTATRYLWHNEEPLKQAILAVLPNAPGLPMEVEVEACYWRKANHVHKWFVTHVQDNVDDCNSYYVTKEKLKLLVDTCKQVLNDTEKASVLLPTQEGFFFGSTEYDEGYFDDLKHTIKMLKPLIGKDKFKGWDFKYHSSW